MKFFLLTIACVTAIAAKAQQKITLAGQWAVQLDADSAYYKKNTPPQIFKNTILLPGSTDEAKLGEKTSGSDYGILTRAYKHIGPAWYQRTIDIPANWAGKNVSLFLERVLWQSKIFIDGKEISTLSPLYVPHHHQLGKLPAGRHILTICINNDLIHNIGDKGHGYTEYTQSIWNGITGRIELLVNEGLSINQIKTYPDAIKQQLKIEAFINSEAAGNVILSATLKDLQSGKIISNVSKKNSVKIGNNKIDFLINNLKHIKTWNEFTPNLYEVQFTARHGSTYFEWKEKVGFRNLTTTKNKILLNDKAVLIRGNLDCVHFPLTGYPSCKTEDWEKIFKKYKEFGLNTVRFHSWTPPRAAFEAADKLGIYIQTEIIWLDWWMAAEQKHRPEMNTKNYPQGLGHNPGADAFVQAEMQRVIDEYGNHPSFMFFCIGNELGNSNFDVMQTWVQNLKMQDPRRFYAVSTARKIMPVDDYMVTHNIPGVGKTYGYSLNSTDADLEKQYAQSKIPIIAHEVGQVPVYPLWKEIDTYKGVLKARNLQQFKATAIKNGIADQDKSFHQSSGSFQQLLYKNLIENVLLAPSSAGFQLLSMQDYQGQGEALVGWLDAQWQDKNTTAANVFRGYSNAVVPLIRTSNFTYTHSDTFRVGIEVSNYYHANIHKQLLWEIRNASGKPLQKGIAQVNNFPQGKLIKADSLNIALGSFPKTAAQYTFHVYFADKSYSNSWQFYVFPDTGNIAIDTGSVLVSREWNKAVDDALAKGKKVLLVANELGTKATSAGVKFLPLFWSASFFPGQDNETLGSLINVESKAFEKFPTQNFTNWQWYKITKGAKYFKLSSFPKSYKPLVQPVSDFHFNEKLGSIFEAKVGNGKLMVCGYDILQLRNAYARQLYYSLIEYIKSSYFNPQSSLPATSLQRILAKEKMPDDLSQLPAQFKNALLFIHSGINAKGPKPWAQIDDEVVINKGFTYTLTEGRTSKAGAAQSWSGKKINMDLKTPAGIKGHIHVYITNLYNKKLEGTISIEGRNTIVTDVPAEGKWIKVFLMREDTNDGKINISITSTNDEPLQVNTFAIVQDD